MLPDAIRSLLRSAQPLRPSRRGLSIVLLTFVLVLLAFFVAFAVDIGRMRVAKAQLQTAADAAAISGVRELQFAPADGIELAEDTAIEVAAQNPNLDAAPSGQGGMRRDSAVNLVPVEDVEFGIWRESTRSFELVEDDGGIDDRRRANAVRAWGRRVTQFDREDMFGGTHTITRNDGLPLIFGPFFSTFNGEIQTRATAYITGGQQGGFGFIGLNSIKFNGTTRSDSYTAATETYPGANGPNKLGDIASNGDITLVGGTEIWGDVRPGVDRNIIPIPLSDNVEVTGYMNPLETPLDYKVKAYTPPTTQGTYNVNGSITPTNALSATRDYTPKGKNNRLRPPGGGQPTTQPSTQPVEPTRFWFKSWTSGSSDEIFIENDQTPIEIWIDGNLKNGAQAKIHITSNNFPVTFHVNGNFDMQGGGIVNDLATVGGVAVPSQIKPENLVIDMTGTGTMLDIGGNPTMAAHIYAPGSDVRFHGNGQSTNGFWGRAIGRSLTVNGNFEVHYDESLSQPAETPWRVRMVE